MRLKFVHNYFLMGFNKDWTPPAFLTAHGLDTEALSFNHAVRTAYHAGCPISYPKRHRASVPWWNDDLAKKKNLVMAAKRKVKETSHLSPTFQIVKNILKETKKRYRKAI